MKKLVSLLLALLMLMGMMAVPTMAAEDVKVYLFGEKLEFDVPAQIVNGRTMVPVRKIFESLGYTVDWNNDTRTAIATGIERTINITIDSPVMYVNSESKALDVPACIIDGRTLVPARAIAEASGYKVDWDGNTRSVLITQPEETATDLFDEVANVIKEKGTYDASESCYYMADRDSVTVKYYQGNEQYREEIVVTYLQLNSDGSKSYTGVALAKDGAREGLFEYQFTSGHISSIYGTFSAETGRFVAMENTFSDEIRTQAFNMFISAIRYEMDNVFEDFTGYSFKDFGINP